MGIQPAGIVPHDGYIHTLACTANRGQPAAEGVVGQVSIAKRELTDRHEIYVGELTHNGQLTQEQTGHFQYGQFRRVGRAFCD